MTAHGPKPGRPPSRLPMTVIAGYLGAGKTTLLNNLLAGDHGERIIVLVNDFGEIALDESLITNRSGDTISLANGCMCCSIGGDLWDAIDRVLTIDPRPDRLVIETSGVADPAKVSQIALADPELGDAGTVTVADTLNLQALLADPLLADTVERQLRAASLIVQSKTDLADAQTSASVTETIARIAPGIPIALCDAGGPDPALLLSLGRTNPAAGQPARPGPLRIAPDTHGALYESWAWSGAQAVDRERLEMFLRSEDSGAWRIKGVVRTDTGAWLEVHRAGTFVTLTPVGGAPANGEIVAIGLAGRFRREKLAALWDQALAAR